MWRDLPRINRQGYSGYLSNKTTGYNYRWKVRNHENSSRRCSGVPLLISRRQAVGDPDQAVPYLEIERDPSLAYKYTAKGNLVGVVSNGTAVLGLGNIGALAGKPVMEGKAVLFKRFADIDGLDIELDTKDPEEIIRTCQILEPTFGGINLEDI